MLSWGLTLGEGISLITLSSNSLLLAVLAEIREISFLELLINQPFP